MKNSKLISEAAKVSAEVITVTSAAGATSTPVDMQNYRRALLVAAANGNFTEVTLDLMESTAATIAGSSAAGSKVGIVVGSSVNTSIPTMWSPSARRIPRTLWLTLPMIRTFDS